MLWRVGARGSVGSSGRRFDEDQLLDAARAVFHAEGYSAAQIADIARRAGTTKPTFYARLGNKEEIYRRVIVREVDVLRSWITDAYEHGVDLPLDDLAETGMEPIFRFAAERPQGFDLLFRGDRPTDLRQSILRVVTDMLADVIVQRQQAFGSELGSNAEPLAAAAVGVAVQVCEHAIDNGNDLGDAHRLAAHFVASAFRGLDFEALAK
ncbi:TetR/AcrR family transcriptional regulator [Mycolicibacterium setense]